MKGWYRAAGESSSRPCFFTLERQTFEREELYRYRRPPRAHTIPCNVDPFNVADGVPTNEEIRDRVRAPTNGRSVGTSFMRAEDLKEWLRGVLMEEDPKLRDGAIAANGGCRTGQCWRIFIALVRAIWMTGEIPRQLRWILVVLLLKGGDGYRDIGLMEPIWKIIEGNFFPECTRSGHFAYAVGINTIFFYISKCRSNC